MIYDYNNIKYNINILITTNNTHGDFNDGSLD